MGFYFNPLVFCYKNDQNFSDEDSQVLRDETAKIRSNYHELSHWCDYAVSTAWSSFSIDALAIGDACWLHDIKWNAFLAYIYIRTICPKFEFGGTGLYQIDLKDYADTLPWLVNAPMPEWVK